MCVLHQVSCLRVFLVPYYDSGQNLKTTLNLAGRQCPGRLHLCLWALQVLCCCVAPARQATEHPFAHNSTKVMVASAQRS